jgi:hypothetical protein
VLIRTVTLTLPDRALREMADRLQDKAQVCRNLGDDAFAEGQREAGSALHDEARLYEAAAREARGAR